MNNNIIIIKGILRINNETYIDGYICIDKKTDSIIKCIFCLDKVAIAIKKGRIHVYIEEFEPDENEFWSLCEYVSYENHLDNFECPKTYNLKCITISGVFAQLELKCVTKDPFELRLISESLKNSL